MYFTTTKKHFFLDFKQKRKRFENWYFERKKKIENKSEIYLYFKKK